MGWIIFADIVLITILILALSVTAVIKVTDTVEIKIKYAGITLFSIGNTEEEENKDKDKKKKKKKKKKEKKKKDKKKKEDKKALKKADENKPAEKIPDKKEDEKPEEEKVKNPKVKIDFELIKMLLESASKPVKRLINHIRLTIYKAEIIVAGDDAAEVALNYGKMNVAVYNLLAFLDRFIRLKADNVKIGVDFISGTPSYDIYCKVKMRLSTALGCAFWLVGRIAVRYIKLMKAGQETPSAGKEINHGRTAPDQ